MEQHSLGPRVLAEFVGTFTLTFIAAGSIIAATAVLGGQGGAGLVTTAIAYGLAVAAMVSAIGHVSGGHLNPAVTVGALVAGRIGLRDSLAYLVAQLGGGVVAGYALRAAVPEGIWKVVDLGATRVNTQIGLSTGQGVLIEALLTFFLVWVVFATAVDGEGAFAKVAGLAIGFVVLMDVMVGGPLTGGSMNPARSFGPAVAGSVWDDHWVYWVGPVAGGVVAAVAYDLGILRPREARTPQG